MTATTKTLSALLQKATIDDHEEILKACNGALKTSRNDPELLHTRVVALLKLERYEDALKALDEQQDRLKGRTQFEKAYSLYKIGHYEDAKATAKSIVSDRGVKHVEAQAVRNPRHFPFWIR